MYLNTYLDVPWEVEPHDAFVPEFEALDEAVQDELLAHVNVLEVFGPRLGRPRVDTLKAHVTAT